jgi:hypothetical protein
VECADDVYKQILVGKDAEKMSAYSYTHLAWGSSVPRHVPGLGLSTVPYTATAVLLTVSIRPWAVPYGRRIHEVESPRRYGTVIATAGIRVKTAIRNEVT